MPNECGVKIVQVRVSNFRSLENIEVDLDDLTLLIGANNSGKTSFLDALHAAIGVGRRVLMKEDIHLKNHEKDVPKSRRSVIDLRVQPCRDDTRELLDSFPRGSFWTHLWGDMITQDDQIHEFIGIRTVIEWDDTRTEYRMKRKFLKKWNLFSEWLDTDTSEIAASSQHLEPIALYYMNAQRDIDADLRASGSFWRRLVNDLGLSEELVTEFETILTDVNARIVKNSPILNHLHQHLVDIDPVDTSQQNIGITSVARHLRDLAQGIDIHFATVDAPFFPLAKHGMGTRSLASILVFRAYAKWMGSQSEKNSNKVHMLLALEEPEAHLHPQAQRALFGHIKRMPGQRIISTHSPYFAGQAQLEDFRLFQKLGGQSKVSKLDVSVLEDKKYRRKLEQQIIQTRGDILFCRALILFEGETEELSMPVFAKAYWGQGIHELGFNFVKVGGGDYAPFIWLAMNLKIKWYIFSDGEERTINSLDNTLKKLDQRESHDNDHVFVLPNGNNIEKYFVANGYVKEIEEALYQEKKLSVDDYMKEHEGQQRRKSIIRNYKEEGRDAAVLDIINENKTDLAIPVATAITETENLTRRVPEKIAELFEKISIDFGIPKVGGGP
ncbi:MAG: AAA family ATPase [Magnetococcales bacterium]|nr:AAA family ATPase [Magnetococcales bacterium]